MIWIDTTEIASDNRKIHKNIIFVVIYAIDITVIITNDTVTNTTPKSNQKTINLITIITIFDKTPKNSNGFSSLNIIFSFLSDSSLLLSLSSFLLILLFSLLFSI